MSECNHEYSHISTHYRRSSHGGGVKYSRLDIYTCLKCLDQKEILREEPCYCNEAEPIWWK